MSNNVTIIGRLGRDGEGKQAGGVSLFEFSVADDVGYGDKKTTNWWRCALWGKQAEGKITDFLKKGQQVAVMGEITLREWEDKDGNKKLSPEIRVNSVQFVGSKSDSQQSGSYNDVPQSNQERRAAAPQKYADPKDEDIPFAPLGLQSRFSVLVM